MQIKQTYPPLEKRKFQRKRLLNILRWPLLAAGFCSLVVNYILGGVAWSVVAVAALYSIWTLVFSIDLVEYNRISQFIKGVCCVCILLGLIDWLLAPGWAIFVVPLVCSAGLITSGTLFFTDLQRQKHNMLPLLLLILFSLIGGAIGFTLWSGRGRWAMIVMGGTAFALLVACISTLGGEFFRELKRRFHTK